MNTNCDTCDKPAKYDVTGWDKVKYLCPNCAAYLCRALGDKAGYDKFKAVSNA